MQYIRFNDPKVKGSIKKPPTIGNKFLELFIPKANPDFDKLYPDVKYWFIEIGDDDIPYREIGFDVNDRPMVVGPCRENLGFWTDTDLTYDYLVEHFNAIEISESTFEEQWERFANPDVEH